MSSNEPSFMTPEIKAMLRRKNKLMHAGKTEQADALAARIGKEIIKHNTAQFKCIDAKVDASDMWHKVKQLSSRSGRSDSNCALTADQLNKHYATISHNMSYSIPVPKSADGRLAHVVYEWEIFYILAHGHRAGSAPSLVFANWSSYFFWYPYQIV